MIGKNEAGDLVPDVNLPVNERYGNNIRPRQSWYVDRFSALKEIIDYANLVLKKNQLVGQINLDNLDAKEPEPTAQSGEWDGSVDTYAELTYLNTADLSGTVNYLVRADETANNFWEYINGMARSGQGPRYRPTTPPPTGVTQTGTRPREQ